MAAYNNRPILLWLWIVALAYAEALQCPSCTYVNTDAEIGAPARSAIDTVLHAFQEPKCKRQLTEPTPGVVQETCAPYSGQLAMCSFYNGTITVNVDLLGTSLELPLKIYKQGCYYTPKADVPSIGCHNRDNMNEDKSIFKQLLNGAAKFVTGINFVSSTGKLCVCRDTYCKENQFGSTSGVGKFRPTFPFILAPFVLLLLLL